MFEEPFVHQIFTGKKRIITNQLEAENPFDKPWQTSIYKKQNDEVIWLSKTGLAGDEKNSEDKALYAYPIKHYAFWEGVLNTSNIQYGSMGENLSLLEMDEYSVCIGDIYQFGDAVIQVSQPHLPSWEVSKRFKFVNLAAMMQEHGYTGWYFRVLKEGKVLSRIDIELIDRPLPMWTIAGCNEVIHSKNPDFRLLDELASCEALSVNWRNILKARLQGKSFTHDKRLFGPLLK